ncbi:MAG: hypothetical protein WA715_07805 [Candidatus Acidiferrum sp.]
MQVYAYLRVLSDETTIRSLHSETNVPNAATKPTKARRGEGDESVWWNWQTRQVSIEADNLDDGLRELLLSHRAIFPMIKRVSDLGADVYLEVVTQYDQGESPRGLFLSTETVLLLSEMGGAFDLDVRSDG